MTGITDDGAYSPDDIKFGTEKPRKSFITKPLKKSDIVGGIGLGPSAQKQVLESASAEPRRTWWERLTGMKRH